MIPNQPPRDFDHNTEFYENYVNGTYFRSSGHDGFMREFVTIPIDRVVKYEEVPDKVAAISEFVSVGVHGLRRFDKVAHSRRNRIVVWGSGSLAYVVATIAKAKFPESTIIVVGKDPEKLRLFSFVDEVYDVSNLPEDFTFDHAIECVGGSGTQDAYREIIRHIQPQGAVVMMGVSEFEVPLNTRDILEKLEAGTIPTLAETSFALIEFSMATPYKEIHQALSAVLRLGVTPVVAHIERYHCLEKNEKRVRELIRMGCYTQINSSSVLKPKLFGDRYKFMKHRAQYFLEKDLVYFVASDMHNVDQRPPYMEKAYQLIEKTLRK